MASANSGRMDEWMEGRTYGDYLIFPLLSFWKADDKKVDQMWFLMAKST